MNIFIEKYQNLLKSLLQHKVDFMVIGGYAVIYYGYARTTGDVDIWLKPDNTNRNKVIATLKTLNFDEKDLTELAQTDFKKHLVFSIWEEPEKVDFITRINLVEYEEADKMKELLDIDGIQIPFMHLSHLILSKMNTGRAKDKADVEELQKIIRLKNRK